MSLLRIFPLAAALSAAVPTLALAEARQHGNVVFDLPSGWVTGATRDDGTLVILSRLPDDECEYCYMYVGSGVDRAEDPVFYLKRNPRLFLEEDDGDPKEVVPADAFDLGPHKGAMLGQLVDGELRILMALSVGNRTEVFAFEGNGREPEEIQAVLKVFERDLVPLVSSARFLSDGAKPLLGPAQPGDLAGIYQGSGIRWNLGLDMMMQSSTYVNLYVFWKDGHFYDGTPPDGLQPLDTAAALKSGDMSWGNYRVSGGKLHLDYADGDSDELDFDGNVVDGFSCGETTCYPVDSIADGSKIEGTVDNTSYTGFSPYSGVSGGVGSSSTLTFLADGNWTYKSSTGVSGNFDTGGGYAISGGNQADGSYRIKNSTVIRSFNDGSPDLTSLIYKVGNEILIGSSYFDGKVVR